MTKNRTIIRLTSVLVALVFINLMVSPSKVVADQATVNLGTTSTFAVLAGETITNTGTTVIGGDAGGDIGVYAGSAVTGFETLTTSGTVHLADETAGLAKADLALAYDDAAGRTPVTTIPSELGGATLAPGVYDSADGTFHITGTLTLDAGENPNPVYIFKTTTELITDSASSVSLINGAVYCRVFWQVGSSATLGSGSIFVGHIFALTSITAQTGATIQGQLLARNGSVTLDNNTITNGFCEAAVTPTAAPTAVPTEVPTVVPTVVVAAATPTPTPKPTTEITKTGEAQDFTILGLVCLGMSASLALYLRRKVSRI